MVLIYQSKNSQNIKSKDEIFVGQSPGSSSSFSKNNKYLFKDIKSKRPMISSGFKSKIEKVSQFESHKNRFSSFIEEFLDNFEMFMHKNDFDSISNIKVSDFVGRFARLYEKLRTTIEYKGEHLLRRNAIERIIKRLAWEKNTLRPNIDSGKLSKSLIKELVWAGYLPNDSIPISKENLVKKIIEKYFYLLDNLDNIPEEVSKKKVRSWIWNVASSEIEDLLDPSNRDLYVKLMLDWFNHYFVWNDADLDPEEKQIQIFIAIHRSLPRSDEAIIRYHLLLREFPDWQNASLREINQMIVNFPYIYGRIEKLLNYSFRLSLYRKINKQTAAFEIFKSLSINEKDNLRKILEDKEKFHNKIRRVCDLKYKLVKERVNRGIVRSIIYIFITKVILALFLEVPYEVIRLNEIRYIPLSLNIVFPPFLMFLIGLSIKTPGAKNTERLIKIIDSIVYKDSEFTKQEISLKSAGTSKTFMSIYSFFYIILFAFVFGGIFYILEQLGFSLFGSIVCFMFFFFVLLFVFRVQYQANLLMVELSNVSFFETIISYLTLPLVNLGYLLSKNLAKLNFLTILLDLIIEAPLKNIIEILEDWVGFLKEKREEVIEVPE